MDINKKYLRTGTLWEGRHRSSLVQSERYPLTRIRYTELNPVRANMVHDLKSAVGGATGMNVWGDGSWLKPHGEYLRLGDTEEVRCHVYRALLMEQLNEHDLHLIRKAAHYCQPVGDDRFREQIEDRPRF